ncbi:hypothetical protein BH10BDE1_BH10BDE1_12600 [soil metagenome]
MTAIEYEIISSNLSLDIPFYCDYFDFEIQVDLVMATGERKVLLRHRTHSFFKIRFVLNPELYTNSQARDLPRIGFQIKNLANLKRRLRENGLTFFDESDHPYGSWAKIKDPSGNCIQLGEFFSEE